ncbi:dual specificity protein phosphatase family protein [bacterium]|nr:dual specificity protein phosphatase family protein [bacterium]
MAVNGINRSLQRELVSPLARKVAQAPQLEATQAAQKAAVRTAQPEAQSFSFSELKRDILNAGSEALIRLGDLHPSLVKLGHAIYGFQTRAVDGDALQKLGKLGDKVLRGAQPTDEGFAELAKQGYNTVINLRPERNLEKDVVEKLGMKAVFLPLPPLDAPTHAQTLDFLKAALDPANGKVFFHCYHGVDRTGTMAAAIRIARDGWSAEQAIKELHSFGFHDGGQQRKLAYISEFERFWKALPAAQKAEVLHGQPAAPASRLIGVG